MKKALIVIAVFLIALAGYLAYEGMFTPATVQTTEEGPYLFMGIEHKGPYQDIMPVFKKLEAQVKEKQIKDAAFAGVYFDDPKTVAEDQLRSLACVVVKSAEDSLLLAGIEGIKVYPIEHGKALVCERNTSNMVSMIISVMKAYPAISKHIETHPELQQGIKHVYELYRGDKTRFVFQY